MQTGRFVVDPATLRNVPKHVMRSLGEMLGLYVPDYILLFYIEQYPHLQLKSNVRLCGDPTRMIREYTYPITKGQSLLETWIRSSMGGEFRFLQS